jgi:glycosyltransferase involved in cell wall biosynthesis
MSKRPEISIIVPAYNAAPALSATIESIELQDFDNFELIIIDDNSTDDTAVIAETASQRYDNIVVVHNPKNLGIGAVRNLGITYATGKYIAFIDADDLIRRTYLSTLHELATKNSADIAVVGYQEVYQTRKPRKDQRSRTILYSQDECISDFLHYGRDLGTFVWGKLFRRDLFADIKFPEGVIYEDIATLYKLYLQANKLAYNPKLLYDYIQRTASSVHTHRNPKDINFLLSIPDAVDKALPDADPKDLLYFRFRINIAAFNSMLTSSSLDHTVALEIIKFIRIKFVLIRKLKLSFKERVQLNILALGIAPYQFLHLFQRNLLGKITK